MKKIIFFIAIAMLCASCAVSRYTSTDDAARATVENRVLEVAEANARTLVLQKLLISYHAEVSTNGTTRLVANNASGDIKYNDVTKVSAMGKFSNVKFEYKVSQLRNGIYSVTCIGKVNGGIE